MAGGKTAALGRMLTALGVLWMGWAIVTELIRVDPDIQLPFLPGLIIFFVGRAMARAGGRESDAAPEGSQVPAPDVRPSPPRPRPARSEPDRTRREQRLEPEPAQEPEHSLPDLEKAILETPPPKSSAEMVAEAKRLYAPRPPGKDE